MLAYQSLRATKSIAHTLANVHSLIKPGGKLLFIETTRDELDKQLVFGLLPEWWQSESDEFENSGPHRPSLDVLSWDRILKISGFNGIDIDISDCENDHLYTTSTILSTVPPTKLPQLPASDDIVFITSSKARLPQSGWLESLLQSISMVSSGPLPIVHVLESAAATKASSYTGKICIFLGEMEGALLATSKL